MVRITEREREILTILGSHAGDNVPREALAGNGIAANERTVDVQINRLRRKIETDPQTRSFPDRARRRVPPRSTDEDRGDPSLHASRPRRALVRTLSAEGFLRPRAHHHHRAVILLQSVVAYVFMERHYQLVTRRLSSAVTADIAALIDIYESYPQDKDASTLARIASERLQLDVDILRNTDLPPPGPKPFFDILDETLTDELRRQIDRPYWVDTVGRSSYVEVRVKLNQNDVMRILARRSQAYASNSHIFLVWMGGSSFVLLGIAILFLRNQIRPILRLAEAAELSARGARSISDRAARARCARPATPSSR